MEEVTTVSTTAVGDSNHTPSTLDSTNEISATTATVAGDREDKVNSGNGHESNEDDVSKRSRDKKDKDRSRSRSKDRDSGSRKHKRRHRSRDRDRDHDRKRRSKSKDRDEGDGDKDKEKKSSSRRDRHRDKDRDRDRDRHRRSSRSRDRDRHRDRSRDRDRRRDRDRDRDRHDRDRDRDRRRSRSTSSERRDKRRREDRERDRSEERREERRRERQAERERREKEDEASGRITLRDVITQNPGISVPDALQRMHAINTAMASGTEVPPLVVPMGQPVAPATMNPALGMVPQAGISGPAMAQQQFAATKSQREIYVGNIPPQITIPQLTEFVNEAMKQLGLSQPSAFGGPVVTCWISTDAHYAFIELRTIEEAQAALTGLNGVSCAGYQLRVGRPKTPGGGGGGGVPQQQQLGMGLQPLGGGLGQVLGGGGLGAGGLVAPLQPLPPPVPVEPASNVLMVANLPDVIGEEQVRELLAPFGAIKLFNFIKVPMNGGTGGAAVLEYEDPSVGEGAITGLNGLPVGDKQLSVQRVPANMAALLLKPAAPSAPAPPAPPSVPVPVTTTETQEDNDPLLTSSPTAVIRMSNMTNLTELRDDEIYEELQEDIADECNSHGTVRSLAIPRPTADSTESEPGAGVGEVFVCFTHADGAEKAKQAVHGRTFNGLRVKAVFYPEELFHAKVYTLPEGFIMGGGGGVAEEDSMD